MVVLKFVSTLALVSLFSASFPQLVAGRPHEFGAHNNHVGGAITKTVTEYSTRYVRSTQITTISPDAANVQPAVQTNIKTKSKSTTKRTTFTTIRQQPSHSNDKSATKSITVSVEPSSTTSSPPEETNTKYPAARYSLVKSYCNGGSFFDEFNFFTGDDPTHGFVQYNPPHKHC